MPMTVDKEGVYCVKNRGEDYMIGFTLAWKHETLADCCWANFQWDFKDCMGDSDTDGKPLPLVPCTEPLPEPSGKWYVNYYSENDSECVRECIGEYPCNGRATSFNELYNTFRDCCNSHTW